MTSVGRQVIVHGRVQGVFFRDSCRRRAEELGVLGWVRNRPDGTVEALFSGSEAAVDAMINWSRQGPTHAEVSSIEVTEAGPFEGSGFTVR